MMSIGMFLSRTVQAFTIVLSSVQLVACMEHKLDGKTASEVFTDPKVAALAQAACSGSLGAVTKTLGEGANVNATGMEQITPLMWALTCENLAGMEALLKAGANPNQDNGRFTAVYAAATRLNPEPLKLLLRYGGNANVKDLKSSDTALQQALIIGARGDGWTNYYSLLEKADINLADTTGTTIASYAVALGQFDKVIELLERGYSYDLVILARDVEVRVVDPKSPQFKLQLKVRAMLEARGIKFPIGPLNDRKDRKNKA